MDVVGLKKIHLLIWQHAAKYFEVCTVIVGLHAFIAIVGICVVTLKYKCGQ